MAGRWDGARVAIGAVDWTNVANRVGLGEGTIGAIETADGGFTAELRGVTAAFDAPVCEVTAPECRAELGDARCRAAMAGRRRVVRVLAIEGEALTVDAAEPVANAYGSGRLRWLDGANSGLEAAVDRSDGAVIVLREGSRLPVSAGDRCELIEGCDKRLATCATRFANAANFRGEPFLPGIDLLTRYPGA